MFDVLINHGMIIDGTGMPRYKADVGIHDGEGARIGGSQGKHPAKVIDAEGLVVAPGFIDLHTHYDAQINWDPYCTLFSWHGVTSVALGNCSVGIAPCNSEKVRNRARFTTSHVEDLLSESTKDGMTGDWTVSPGLFDFVELSPREINIYASSPPSVGRQVPCFNHRWGYEEVNDPLIRSADAWSEPEGVPPDIVSLEAQHGAFFAQKEGFLLDEPLKLPLRGPFYLRDSLPESLGFQSGPLIFVSCPRVFVKTSPSPPRGRAYDPGLVDVCGPLPHGHLTGSFPLPSVELPGVVYVSGR